MRYPVIFAIFFMQILAFANPEKLAQSMCEMTYSIHNCAELATDKNGKPDSEIANKLIQCSSRCGGFSESSRQAFHVLKSCHAGAVEATADFFTWIDQTYKSAISNIAQKNEFYKTCDLNCKRKLARGELDIGPLYAEPHPEYVAMNDEQLAKTSAVTLEHIAIVRENMARQSEFAERARKFDPIRDPRVFEKEDNSLLVEKLSPYQQMEILTKWGVQAAGSVYQKMQCFKAEYQAELICYGIFTVLDPTIAIGMAYKSPFLFKMLQKAGRIPAKASSATARNNLVSKYLGKKFSTIQQNRQWIQIAKTSDARTGYLFLDTENSVMKSLNDSLKDKDLVTSLTNKYKELQSEAMEDLKTIYADKVEFFSYDDFKSQRFAFLPKPPETKLPADFVARLEKTFTQTNSQFSNYMKSNGLDPANASENWFRAGIGATADEANMATRISRELSNRNQLRNFENSNTQSNILALKGFVEHMRKDFRKELRTTNLMENGYFKDDVLDIIRKTSDPQELQNRLKKKYGAQVSTLSAERMQTYAATVDRFNPGIYMEERLHASLESASSGGLAADFVGLGAKNLGATARALADTQDLRRTLSQIRKNEIKVTSDFEDAKADFEKVVSKHLKSAVTSGDDFVGIAKTALTDTKKAEILNDVAKLPNPAGQRISFIDAHVKKSDRNMLATHGESFEKNLRQSLEGVISNDKLNKIVIAVDMKGQSLGQGQVKLLIGEAQVGLLSESEKNLMQQHFANVVKDFNQKLQNSGIKSQYEP